MKFDIFYRGSTVADVSTDTLKAAEIVMESEKLTGVIVIRYPEGAKVEMIWYNQGRRRKFIFR
jgi:hypothetical protein